MDNESIVAEHKLLAPIVHMDISDPIPTTTAWFQQYQKQQRSTDISDVDSDSARHELRTVTLLDMNNTMLMFRAARQGGLVLLPSLLL